MSGTIPKLVVIGIFFLLVIGGGLFFYQIIQREYFATPTETETQEIVVKTSIIGKSVEGRNIEAYTFGDGQTQLLFVGGIHGGYEWNSIALAYRFIDFLTDSPIIIPDDITVTIIPSLNPDGLYKISGKTGRVTEADIPGEELTIPGRFNANGVDLNRNFDCKWKSESSWRGQTVSAGTSAFSEPEALALKNLVQKIKPSAVVFWHSQSNAVYASECENGILPKTSDIMNAYATASGYPAIDTFDAYPVTGDAEGWLASINIPAITVELSTHQYIEWEKNLAGVKAILGYFSKK